jgi:hypothetical protein
MTASAPETTKAGGNTLSIIGIVCGVVAILFLPIILGPVGIVLGIIGRQRGERLGTIAIVVAAVGMIIGMILGYLVVSNS